MTSEGLPVSRRDLEAADDSEAVRRFPSAERYPADHPSAPQEPASENCAYCDAA